MRNHGFIFDPAQGWFLSPAFDMNPVSDGDGLKLNISETDNAQKLVLAKSVAAIFRISASRTDDIIMDVIKAVKSWRIEATRLGLSLQQQDAMKQAFRECA